MSELSVLATRVQRRQRELDSLWGEARATLARGRDLRVEIETTAETINDYERVTLLLNSLGEERQNEAQHTIEELVTRGLQTIFDDSLTFHILQSVRGKTANVEFLVRTTLPDGVIETPVLDARGGGVAQTIGFLLRVVVMLLTRGTRKENLLVLDETFSMVSEEYLQPLGEFLREIVDKTGIQIVMVTHQSIFTDFADKVHRFESVAGKTVVVES